MKPILTLLAALCLAMPVLSRPVLAHDFTAGDLQIKHPHIPQPSASAKAAGGFFTIVNTGGEADRLVGVESDLAAKSMVHESRVDANGVGTMTHVDAIDIPVGETVTLQHGGLHIMFMGLTAPLIEGELHKATLIFERAGRVEVEFSVDAPTGQGDSMDHSTMDHAAEGHSDHGAASN